MTFPTAGPADAAYRFCCSSSSGASRTNASTIAAEFRLARSAGPVDAALRIVIEALGLTRALKPRVRLPVMEHAHRYEVVHRVVATQPRRHNVVHAEPIPPTADHAGVSVSPAHRGPYPLPLAGVDRGGRRRYAY